MNSLISLPYLKTNNGDDRACEAGAGGEWWFRGGSSR